MPIYERCSSLSIRIVCPGKNQCNKLKFILNCKYYCFNSLSHVYVFLCLIVLLFVSILLTVTKFQVYSVLININNNDQSWAFLVSVKKNMHPRTWISLLVSLLDNNEFPLMLHVGMTVSLKREICIFSTILAIFIARIKHQINIFLFILSSIFDSFNHYL